MSSFHKIIKSDQERQQTYREAGKDRRRRQLVLITQDEMHWIEGTRLISVKYISKNSFHFNTIQIADCTIIIRMEYVLLLKTNFGYLEVTGNNKLIKLK